MPQASEELRAKFPGGDGQAWDVLIENFLDDRGRICARVPGYKPTEAEGDAIDYLCDEWDYEYVPAQ